LHKIEDSQKRIPDRSTHSPYYSHVQMGKYLQLQEIEIRSHLIREMTADRWSLHAARVWPRPLKLRN